MEQNFREEKIVDVNDLANGYYPHLPKVSLTDVAEVLAWFHELGIPKESGFWTGSGLDPVLNTHKYLPTEIRWQNEPKSDLFLDAALVFNFPHVSRVELLNFFGLRGADQIVMYPGPRKAVDPVGNPIGDPWPEQGDNAFHPSAEDKFPLGTVFTSAAGETFHKERRQVAFNSFAVWVKTS